MGAIAVDINNIMDVNAVAFRVLSDTLGNDATEVFLGQFRKRKDSGKPRLTASQIADALEQGKAEAARLSESVGGGRGDFTKERHKRPQLPEEEVWNGIMRLQEAGLNAGKVYEKDALATAGIDDSNNVFTKNMFNNGGI